jgi:hypothetical protein
MTVRPNGGEQSIGADLLNRLGILGNLEYPPVHLPRIRVDYKDVRCSKRHEIGDMLLNTWSHHHPEAGRAVRRWLLCKAC